jgi:hypothetical protein
LSATAAHADQFWTQNSADVSDTAESGDDFGGRLAVANFGAGSQADLAIGVPLEDSGSVANSGAVNVIYGSSNGLSATAAREDQFWTQNIAGIEDVSEAGEAFGIVGTGNFGAGSQADLAIGVPGEEVGGMSQAGAVHVIYGSADGLSATAAAAAQFWTQNSAAVEDVAETGDVFGGAFVAANFGAGDQDDLAIGVPSEDLGALSSVGGVNVIYGSGGGLSATVAAPDQFWTQDSPDVEDAAEQADSFGRSLAALR